VLESCEPDLSATSPTAVGGVPLPAGGDRGEVAGAPNRKLEDPSTADKSGEFCHSPAVRGSRRALGRKGRMRFAAFALLGFVANGCAIHVVEQPATPVMVVEAPPPARILAQPGVYVPVATPVHAAPTRVAPRAEAPVATRPSFARPLHRGRPHVAKPAARPSRAPFNTAAPESRVPHLASVVPPKKHRRPQKVKQDEPRQNVSSTDVAKAQ
jgi:hypothetical protein